MEESMPRERAGGHGALRKAERPSFTRREVEVLRLIAEGLSSQAVADMLCVSKRTVDFHLANIYEKMHVSNRVQAMRQAARLGLLPGDNPPPTPQ